MVIIGTREMTKVQQKIKLNFFIDKDREKMRVVFLLKDYPHIFIFEMLEL